MSRLQVESQQMWCVCLFDYLHDEKETVCVGPTNAVICLHSVQEHVYLSSY